MKFSLSGKKCERKKEQDEKEGEEERNKQNTISEKVCKWMESWIPSSSGYWIGRLRMRWNQWLISQCEEIFYAKWSAVTILVTFGSSRQTVIGTFCERGNFSFNEYKWGNNGKILVISFFSMKILPLKVDDGDEGVAKFFHSDMAATLPFELRIGRKAKAEKRLCVLLIIPWTDPSTSRKYFTISFCERNHNNTSIIRWCWPCLLFRSKRKQ